MTKLDEVKSKYEEIREDIANGLSNDNYECKYSYTDLQTAKQNLSELGFEIEDPHIKYVAYSIEQFAKIMNSFFDGVIHDSPDFYENNPEL